MRAEPPSANARTWSSVAIVVSPGKVVSSAPCAQPSLIASSGGLAREQAVDESRGKSVAAADAIEHIQFRGGRGVSLAVDPGHRAPGMAIGGVHLAQGSGHDLHVRQLLHHVVHHAEEHAGIEFRFRRHFGAGNAEPFLQILFIADQHVDILDNAVRWSRRRAHRRRESSRASRGN